MATGTAGRVATGRAGMVATGRAGRVATGWPGAARSARPEPCLAPRGSGAEQAGLMEKRELILSVCPKPAGSCHHRPSGQVTPLPACDTTNQAALEG